MHPISPVNDRKLWPPDVLTKYDHFVQGADLSRPGQSFVGPLLK